MEALQTIVDIFGSMGGIGVTAIFVLVALVLIWLIVRASRRSTHAGDTPKHRYDNQPPIQQKASPQPDALQQSADVSRVDTSTPADTTSISGTETFHEPEDSVLHRHYEAQLEAQKEALTHPYPTDSVQRRHYDTQHKIRLDAEPPKAATTGQVAAAANAGKDNAAKASIIEQAINKDGPAVSAPSTTPKPATHHSVKLKLPQDSVLKRHAISQLQAEIAAGLSPRPSDSVLRRHYDSLIQHELEKRLMV